MKNVYTSIKLKEIKKNDLFFKLTENLIISNIAFIKLICNCNYQSVE